MSKEDERENGEKGHGKVKMRRGERKMRRELLMGEMKERRRKGQGKVCAEG